MLMFISFLTDFGELWGGCGWVYFDYSVSSGPFLRFSKRFEFLSEMFDHSVCETRDPSLTIGVCLVVYVG